MKWAALSILPLNEEGNSSHQQEYILKKNGVGDPKRKIIVIEYAHYFKNNIMAKIYQSFF